MYIHKMFNISKTTHGIITHFIPKPEENNQIFKDFQNDIKDGASWGMMIQRAGVMTEKNAS